MAEGSQFSSTAYTANRNGTKGWVKVGSCQECAALCTDAFACSNGAPWQCQCAAATATQKSDSSYSVYQILQADNYDISCLVELFAGDHFTGISSRYYEGAYWTAQINPINSVKSLRISGGCAMSSYSLDGLDISSRTKGTLVDGSYPLEDLIAFGIVTDEDSVRSFTVEPLWQQYGPSDSRCSTDVPTEADNQGACQKRAKDNGWAYYDYNSGGGWCATANCAGSPKVGNPGYSVFAKSANEGKLLVQIRMLSYSNFCLQAGATIGDGARVYACDSSNPRQLFYVPFFGVNDYFQVSSGSTLCLLTQNNAKTAGTLMVTGNCTASALMTNLKWGPDHLLYYPRAQAPNMCFGTHDKPPTSSTHAELATCSTADNTQLWEIVRPSGLATTTVTTTKGATTTPTSTTTSTTVSDCGADAGNPFSGSAPCGGIGVPAPPPPPSGGIGGIGGNTMITTTITITGTTTTTPAPTETATTTTTTTTPAPTTTATTTSTPTTTATTTSTPTTTTTTSRSSTSTWTSTTTTSSSSTSTKTTTTTTSSSSTSTRTTTTTTSSSSTSTRTRTTTSTMTTTTTLPPAVGAPSPPPCGDQLEFRDQRGLSCGDWQGQNCSAPPPSGYNSSDLAAVQANCPVSCGVCAGTPAPKVVFQEVKQVAFELQVALNLSDLSQADRESAIKASTSAALGVDMSSIVSVVVKTVPGRRLQAAQPKYNVRCEVVVPPSVQARTIILQATALSDHTSSAFSTFGSVLAAAAGVDASALNVTVTTKPSTSTVTAAISSDGTIVGVSPSSPSPASGGNATSNGTSQPLVTQDCVDNPNFVDEQGEGCSGWVGYACDSVAWLNTEKPYTVNGLLSVQAQCPLSCGTCAPPNRPSPAQLAAKCADDAYTAAWCLRWRGMNCSEATSLGYSAAYQQLLLGRCPLSCGLCGNRAPPLVDTPGFQDELGNSCSSWRGYDCTKMYDNYTRKGMLTVQAACQHSCFNSSRRRLAATCADDSNFSYIQRYTCQDFVGRICTYGTLYLNARWLLGPRASLAWHENLWDHCPVACGRCDPQERPTVSDLLTECQDDPYIENWCSYTWKGQDCHKWNQSVNLVVPNEGEHFNATLFGRCPSTCRLCTPPVCAAGTYRDSRRHNCSWCAPGSYMPTAASGPGAQACALARPGFAVTHFGGVAEEPCALGTSAAASGQGSCDACAPGRFAGRRAMDKCTECAAGWFQASSGASACERCPLGTYGNSTGLTACTSCPAEFTTLLEASTSSEVCGCFPGQWRPVNSRGCEDCPPGMFCPGGHGQFDKGPDLTAQLPPGMMSLEGAVDSVYTCTALEDNCPGYRPLPYTADLFAEVCPGNLSGPRCSECPPHFYLTDDGVCGDCRENHGAWGAGLNIFVAFLAGVYSAERTYRACERFRSEGQFMFFGMVGFVQGLVPLVKMPLAWPRIFKVVFSIIMPFSIPGMFDLWSFQYQMKCYIGQGFILETVKNVTLPLMIFVNVAMLCIVFPLTCRKISRPMAMCCIATLWDGTWMALCVMAIMLFPTDTMPNGKEFLRYNPGVEIGSHEWKVSIPLGLAAILMYVCSYLAYTIIGVCNAPRYFVERAGFGDIFGFIIYVYRPETYWWGLVLYTTNFMYVLIQLFANVYGQIYATLFLGIAMILLEAYVYPSIFLTMNRLNVVMKASNAFFVILSVCFVDSRAAEMTAYTDQIPRILLAIAIIVGAIFVLTAACSMYFGVGKEKWRAVHNQRQAHKARAVMALVTAMPENRFISALPNFFDSDWEQMHEHNKMLTAVFLGVQSGSRWWQQRIIPDARPGVYDRMQVADMARKLVAQRLIGAAMDQNMELHRLLDRLQDLVVEIADDERLNPKNQPVSFAVATALSQKDLKHNLTHHAHAVTHPHRRDKAGAEAVARHGSWLRRLLPLADAPADEKLLLAEHRGSLRRMEEVPVTAETFLQEFGGHGLTEVQLLRLFEAVNFEKDGKVPLARIVAMVLSHAHSEAHLRKKTESIAAEDVVVIVPAEDGSRSQEVVPQDGSGSQELVPREASDQGGPLAPKSHVAPPLPAMQSRMALDERRCSV